MKGLIVGFGRAGKRHAKMLDELGIAWGAVDPNYPLELDSPGCMYRCADFDYTMFYDARRFDFAVIATPPDLHLQQIRQCLDAGLSVLCEKPLCGLGQLAEAEALLAHPNAHKVMVAYNFRHHPKLIEAHKYNKYLKADITGFYPKPPKWMTCWQDRDLPDWGLLLDHVSHDLDILRFLCGDITIENAKYYPVGSFAQDTRRQMWEITVKVPGLPEWEEGRVRLRESVGTYADRRAKLEYEDGGELDIDADPVMFRDMWESFLGGEYYPGLAEAIETQRLLEDAWRLTNEPKS